VDTGQYRISACALIAPAVSGVFLDILNGKIQDHGVGATCTMRDFDYLYLTPVLPLKPKEIRALRLREGARQAVFARYLNLT
jgi:hypothetical protein